jgi:hypothetical protein
MRHYSGRLRAALGPSPSGRSAPKGPSDAYWELRFRVGLADEGATACVNIRHQGRRSPRAQWSGLHGGLCRLERADAGLQVPMPLYFHDGFNKAAYSRPGDPPRGWRPAQEQSELHANALFPVPIGVGGPVRSGAAGRGGAPRSNRMRLWDVTRRTRAPKGPSDAVPPPPQASAVSLPGLRAGFLWPLVTPLVRAALAGPFSKSSAISAARAVFSHENSLRPKCPYAAVRL